MILIADDCVLIAVDKVRVPLLLPPAPPLGSRRFALGGSLHGARDAFLLRLGLGDAPSFLADLLSRGVLGPRLVGMGRTNPRGNAARGRTFQDGRALGALEVAVSVQPDGRDVLGLGDG